MVSIEAGRMTGNSCISIVTVTGQVILNQQVVSPVTMINLAGLPAGLYFVRYSDGDKAEVKKIIKQ